MKESHIFPEVTQNHIDFQVWKAAQISKFPSLKFFVKNWRVCVTPLHWTDITRACLFSLQLTSLLFLQYITLAIFQRGPWMKSTMRRSFYCHK